MHILFLHSNYPAQFGEIAANLVAQHGDRCTFVNERVSGDQQGVKCVTYRPASGATKQTHFCAATFENQIWRSHAAAESVAQLFRSNGALAHDRPDLIVAHSGFVSALFLKEVLPEVPVVGYFEYFYHRYNSDFDFRSDLPPQSELSAMRLQARNAMLLLDLHHCEAGYCPTDFQREQIPAEYQPKLQTIFDGINTDFWKRDASLSESHATQRMVAGVTIQPYEKVVTYVSRGFESMRGSDQFLKVADQVCKKRSDVRVIVVGEDRIAYGGDARFTDGKTFRQWVIDNNDLDLSRIHFVGRVSREELIRVFSVSDAHLYWTVPFVLSWSMLNAMSCSCPVIASNTAPVQEMVRNGQNGLLVDFFDIERWVECVLQTLESPPETQRMGSNARQTIEQNYCLTSCLDKMRSLYQNVRMR
ncbi:Spore coat protein SA [Rubripirellula amarantea]|uniref:Spore coat protein SA n=1 Tax=Rubripirellula amarantea TaxID=2527999 RepID=A0A5C5WR43_9BACT|nr:glycosyltransferase [Rubripirellula amarantea]TWT53038.1 Spore coat protein SA [Rubripirellula amarantea]